MRGARDTIYSKKHTIVGVHMQSSEEILPNLCKFCIRDMQNGFIIIKLIQI